MGHPNQSGPAKPQAPGGKSEDLSKLRHELDQVKAEVEGLRQLLDDKNHWGKLIQSWVGHKIVVGLERRTLEGVLKWSDRYTICIDLTAFEDKPKKVAEVVIHKAAIVLVHRIQEAGEEGDKTKETNGS